MTFQKVDLYTGDLYNKKRITSDELQVAVEEKFSFPFDSKLILLAESVIRNGFLRHNVFLDMGGGRVLKVMPLSHCSNFANRDIDYIRKVRGVRRKVHYVALYESGKLHTPLLEFAVIYRKNRSRCRTGGFSKRQPYYGRIESVLI